MAKITATVDGETIYVRNGDTVIIDIDDGGTVNILADPDSKVKTFRIKFVDDSQTDHVIIQLSTFDQYDLHIDVIDYDETDSVSLMSAFDRYVEAGNTDEYQFSYVGDTGATFNGFLRAKDKGEKDFTEHPPPIIVCFAAGTVIDTDLGPTPVECLMAGDLVKTMDHGLQPLRWIGRRHLDSLALTRHPQLRPVRFAAGSMGHGLPYTDLLVSPQHRIFVSGWQAQLHFGMAEVLIPAIGFAEAGQAEIEKDAVSVTYHHLLFDAHEILTANGLPTESLHVGDMAMNGMDERAMVELNLIFPDLPTAPASRETARMVMRKSESIAVISKVA